MTSIQSALDDSGIDSSVADATGEQFPGTYYPPYPADYLRELLAHLINVSHGDCAAALPSLSEPGLYALAAAIAIGRRDGAAGEAAAAPAHGIPTAALVAELRWRGCRGMGVNPVGATRRGRLVQLLTTFTPLQAPGASPLQRSKLAGACPFCGSPEFQVLLESVRWRCFGCHRAGALLEFAEQILDADAAGAGG